MEMISVSRRVRKNPLAQRLAALAPASALALIKRFDSPVYALALMMLPTNSCGSTRVATIIIFFNLFS